MNTELTADIVKIERPDKVIIATGAQPIIPNIPGVNGPNVVLAEDVLRGRIDPGLKVLVAGGGMIGSETAAYLAIQCRQKVTIVEMQSDIGTEMEGGIRDDLKTVLHDHFVEVVTGTKIAGFTEQGALLERGGCVTLYPCDTVVLAIGTTAYNPLEAELKDVCDVVVVGDALQARRAIEATREGFVAGMNA